jgi:hypothetical protein
MKIDVHKRFSPIPLRLDQSAPLEESRALKAVDQRVVEKFSRIGAFRLLEFLFVQITHARAWMAPLCTAGFIAQ